MISGSGAISVLERYRAVERYRGWRDVGIREISGSGDIWGVER